MLFFVDSNNESRGSSDRDRHGLSANVEYSRNSVFYAQVCARLRADWKGIADGTVELCDDTPLNPCSKAER